LLTTFTEEDLFNYTNSLNKSTETNIIIDITNNLNILLKV